MSIRNGLATAQQSRRELAGIALRSGAVQRQLEPESGARSLVVVKRADPTSHGLNELFADREAQTRAAKPPPGCAVRLKKRFENPLANRFIHPDPRIDNVATQR